MTLRVKTPRSSSLIIVDRDLNGMQWSEAKQVLIDDYNIDFKDMAVVLRTQTSDKEDKQMIQMSLDQTVVQLNEDNVLFLSASEKIKSGVINPSDYPNTVAGLKLLVKDMQYAQEKEQNIAFKQKLNEISSLVEVINDQEWDEDEDEDLDDESDEIFNK
jgi:hypothetical protein